MTRLFAALAALLALALPRMAGADPADIDAAARGVVRVVIMASDGEKIYPVSHGTGFAVTPTRIVTNAHVVLEATQDDALRIGVVPSEGNDAVFARIVAVSPRNDLALLELTGNLRLPPLTVAGNPERDSGEVAAVGYPMSVDRAQGLDIEDIFSSQPPVKSKGSLAGTRPSRDFDTILHTAPIARGNSGGPLLDPCGRVIGVNSFGADSGNADAEFFFAVSNKELIPFLQANKVDARINALPCRSLAELDEAEKARLAAQQTEAQNALSAREKARAEKEQRVREQATEAVQSERENAMALAFLLVLVGAGAGVTAWRAAGQRGQALAAAPVEDEWDETGEADAPAAPLAPQSDPAERRMMIAGTVCAVALIAALALWFTRPGLDAIDRRVNAAMNADAAAATTVSGATPAAGTLTCTLQVDRSRITGTPDATVEMSWAEDGCVNGRTQYGFSGGDWSRVFVPNEEETVSVNHYDPATRTFRTDRYLLGRNAMVSAREARSKFKPPQCGAANAAADLGDMQGAVTALLPDAPNERYVYSCAVKQ